jgi:hypothetical protein
MTNGMSDLHETVRKLAAEDLDLVSGGEAGLSPEQQARARAHAENVLRPEHTIPVRVP